MTQIDVSTKNQNDTKILSLFFSVWSFILLCRPQDYLSFLVALRPILTVGLFTLFIYLLSKKRSADISSSNQFRLFKYLIIIMIISVPFSYYRSASLKDVVAYASINLMFFFLFFQVVNTTSKLRSLLFVYCSGAAIYAIYILKFGDLTYGRITFGNMFDPNDIAFFIICLITFNFLFISKENAGYKRIIAAVNIIIGIVVILKTGSRSGLVACIAVFAFLMFVKTKTLNLSSITKAIVILAAFLSILSLNLISDRYKTILDVKADYNVTAETGRIAIWKIGMRMMLSHPLTGVGMNRFDEGVGRDREKRGLRSAQWQAAHNSIVQIGAETGIFGLILFCFMSYKVFSITGQIIDKSRSENLVKISEMTRAGFLGHFISAMFLSQAYSVYWVFYIVLSAVLHRMLEMEQT